MGTVDVFPMNIEHSRIFIMTNIKENIFRNLFGIHLSYIGPVSNWPMARLITCDFMYHSLHTNAHQVLTHIPHSYD